MGEGEREPGKGGGTCVVKGGVYLRSAHASMRGMRGVWLPSRRRDRRKLEVRGVIYFGSMPIAWLVSSRNGSHVGGF